MAKHSTKSFGLSIFAKESDDPNSTSGLTAWFNRQHEEVEVPTGDDPWRSVNLELPNGLWPGPFPSFGSKVRSWGVEGFFGPFKEWR